MRGQGSRGEVGTGIEICLNVSGDFGPRVPENSEISNPVVMNSV